MCSYLDAKKYLYVPIQNQGTWNDKGFRQSFKGTRGAPDLIVFDHNLTNGVPYWICIELKSSTGKQSKHQKEFQKVLEEKDGVYYVVRDIKDLEDALGISQ